MCFLEAAQQRTAIVNIDTAHLASTPGKLVLILFYVDDAYLVLEHDILGYVNAQPQHIKLDMQVLFYLLSVFLSRRLTTPISCWRWVWGKAEAKQ